MRTSSAPAPKKAESKVEKKTKKQSDWVVLGKDQLTKVLLDVPKIQKDVDTSSDETKDNGEEIVTRPKLGILLAGFGRGMRGFYYRCPLNYTSTLMTNSSNAGKFILQLAGANDFSVATVSSTAEFTSFNSIFSEFFVHTMTIMFEPSNMNLPGFVNATSTNIQTTGAVIAGYQHNQSLISDSSTAWSTMANATLNKLVHTGRPWRFVWKNIEKFDKNGPLGDQSTTLSTQTWCNMGQGSKYGGYVQMATQYATNAAPSTTTFGASVILGVFIARFDVSFRYRD